MTCSTAKADHGLLMPNREALDLAVELDALLEYYAPLAEDAEVRLVREGEARLEGDRHMLRRALSNLLDNALRLTSQVGRSACRCSPGLTSSSPTPVLQLNRLFCPGFSTVSIGQTPPDGKAAANMRDWVWRLPVRSSRPMAEASAPSARRVGRGS